ncbi:hypothetical protein D9M70_207870 [compost metagenome]
MDITTAALLAQDGITSGAVYGLLALALVLVFSVTRVIFLPQGEFVAYGGLTLAAMQAGHAPQTSLLLVGMGVLTFIFDVVAVMRSHDLRRAAPRRIGVLAVKYLLFPVAVHLSAQTWGGQQVPMAVQVALTLLIIIPLGPMLYRVAYQPLAEASTLVLLIVSVGVHFALVGLGLVMFGAEGSRESGFLVGLKGFVGAIVGGLVSYPLAAAGALLVGLLESYSSFWASAYKEVIVFTLIIPVLLWRSVVSKPAEEE